MPKALWFREATVQALRPFSFPVSLMKETPWVSVVCQVKWKIDTFWLMWLTWVTQNSVCAWLSACYSDGLSTLIQLGCDWQLCEGLHKRQRQTIPLPQGYPLWDPLCSRGLKSGCTCTSGYCVMLDTVVSLGRDPCCQGTTQSQSLGCVNNQHTGCPVNSGETLDIHQ